MLLKRNKTILHILFWISIYLLWVLLFRNYAYPISKTITIEFCYLLFITCDYYAITYLAIPAFLQTSKYALFVWLTVFIIALSAALRAILALQMNMHIFHNPQPVGFGSLYLDSSLNISFWVAIITIGNMLIDRINTQKKLDLLEKERVNSELDYLKAQVNPHALFNSLNTIYGHIDKDNKTARGILLQYSELLRYQLYDCGSEKVSL
jgi:two-component system, LytTR family, sensor kinase